MHGWGVTSCSSAAAKLQKGVGWAPQPAAFAQATFHLILVAFAAELATVEAALVVAGAAVGVCPWSLWSCCGLSVAFWRRFGATVVRGFCKFNYEQKCEEDHCRQETVTETWSLNS